jgi:pimeloyl-ACP methyl ester carboxylesterase
VTPTSDTAAITEGFVQFRGYRTAYRIVHEHLRDSGRIPLVMVHGGPGYPWWKPRDHELGLMASGDRPLVLYDQLGCGRSDRPTDLSLWAIETFVDELATVREQLGLDTVHLLGWSWGGQLALEYLLTKPQGVQSVVLASALHSVPAYVREAHRLAAELPKPVQDTMRRFEEHYRPPEPKSALKAAVSRAPTDKQMARKASSLRWAARIASKPFAQHLAAAASHVGPLRSSAYEVADVAFDSAYICRLNPAPEQLFEMAAGVNERVYKTMWGPGETFVPGNLRDWDVTGRLSEIEIPALVITGRYDAVTPALAEEQCAELPRASRVVLDNSAHTGILEEPERYWSEVFAFLDRVESSGAA